MTEIITLCVRLAIAIMCGIILPVVRHWIEMQTMNAKYERIRQAAETAVYAAEQMLRKADPDGTQRYNFAVSAIIMASEKVGIKLTEKEIESIIEAAVKELNIMQYGRIKIPQEGGADE